MQKGGGFQLAESVAKRRIDRVPQNKAETSHRLVLLRPIQAIQALQPMRTARSVRD